MKIAVEPWQPDYGAPLAATLEPTAAAVDLDVEVPAASWAPIPRGGGSPPPRRVLFVDGVRRVDAWVWVGSPARPGVAASFAAGMVCCEPNLARLAACEVRHGLFSAAPELAALDTPAGSYKPRPCAGDTPEGLVAQVQRAMRDLEAGLGRAAGNTDLDADLLVLDGPLSEPLAGRAAIGWIKTHHTSYLPDAQATVVSALAPGERTPLFLTTGTWSRFSWYLRLPAPHAAGAHWAGVVRCETSGALSPAEARELADLACAELPRYASLAHKDPRAPQNLVPVAGLEHLLRHRLGDPLLCYRALRRAAAAGG